MDPATRRLLDGPIAPTLLRLAAPNVIGVINEIDRERSHPKMRDVAEFGELAQKLEPVAPQHGKTAVEPL